MQRQYRRPPPKRLLLSQRLLREQRQELLRQIQELRAGEVALRRSDELSRAALDTLPAEICVLDEEGKILTVNRKWREFADVNPPILDNYGIGADYIAVCAAVEGDDGESARLFAQGIRGVLAGEFPGYEQEYSCHSQGEQRWFHGRVLPFADSRPVRVVVSHENISGRKELEAALIASETRFRRLFEQHSAVMLLIDPVSSRIVDANSAAVEFYGADLNGLQAMEIRGLVPLPPEERSPQRESREGESKNHITALHCLADGSLRSVEIYTTPITLQEQQLLFAIIHDITERRRIEDELLMTRVSVEAASDAVYWIRPDGRIADVNPAVSRALGYSREELLRMTIHDIDPQYSAEQWQRHAPEVRRLGSMKFETKHRTKEGRLIPVEIITNYVQLEGEARHCAFARDISERKRMEQNLRLSEERHRILADNAIDVISTVGLNGVYSYMSPSVEKLRGYTPAEAMGQPNEEILTPDSLAVITEYSRRLFANLDAGLPAETFRGELEMWCKDGSTVWVEATISPLLDSDGNVVEMLGVTRDISQRREAESELRRSRDEWKRTFDAMPDLIFIIDADYRIRRINQSALDALGIASLDELSSDNCSICMHGGDTPPANCPQARTLQDQKSHEVEILVEQLGRNFQVSTTPIFDAQGNYVESVHVAHDITESKKHERELELAREAADTANWAKSDFLSNMSHEIRTPMNAVLGLAQLLETEQLSAGQLEMVQRIRLAGRSLLGIINDILDFSKIEAGRLAIEQRPFNLPALLEHVTGMSREIVRDKGLQLRLETPAGVEGWLLGDALRLEQILLNLLGNAIKFTRQGDILVRVILQSSTGESVRLRFQVQDSGVGINPEVLPNLFMPFTQADGSITRRFGGTGLGLSICKRLVELMGGSIGVESRVGVGSSFWFEVTFDRTTGINLESVPTARRFAPTGSRLRGVRLLVVDDSDINRDLISRAVALEGAESTPAADGQQALDLLKSERQFDAVLMDIQMPVMDGLTATRHLRQEPRLSSLPVIAFTAGVRPDELQKALDAGVTDFLPKPVDLEEMVAMLLRWTAPRPADEGIVLPHREEQGELLPEPHSCLDVAKGIALCGGEKLYRELLGELVRVHGDDVVGIRTALAAGDLGHAAERVHLLKGVSGNLAAVTIHRITQELESALKQGERELSELLLLRLTEALAELRSLPIRSQEEPPPRKESVPSPLPAKDELSPLLEELRFLLEQRQMAALHVMAQVGELLAGTVVAPESALLSTAMDRLEFEEAHAMLQQLTHRLTDPGLYYPQIKAD